MANKGKNPRRGETAVGEFDWEAWWMDSVPSELGSPECKKCGKPYGQHIAGTNVCPKKTAAEWEKAASKAYEEAIARAWNAYRKAVK